MNDLTAASIAPIAPSDVPIRPERYYRPELDVLRFSAFLMVFCAHVIPTNQSSPRWLSALGNAAGFGAVATFFALSAYLITELLMIEKRSCGTVDVKAFYIRRILRIWPLYFAVLLGGFLISHLHSAWAIPGRGLLAYLFLAGNWYTSRHGYLYAIGVLWSISLEEQFYLVWPLILRSLSRRSLGIVCVLAWVLSQVAVVFCSALHLPVEPTIWTSSLTHLQYFALGAGLSLLLSGSVPRFHARLKIAMVGVAALLFFFANFMFEQHITQDSSLAETCSAFLILGAGTALLLTGFVGNPVFQGSRRARYLGKISYGLYVFHLPCLMLVWHLTRSRFGEESPLVALLIGLPLTILIAWASYKYFESPWLRLKQRFEIVGSRTV